MSSRNNHERTTVLTTGVGAIIGYGILRSLKKSGRPLRLIASDIYADAAGQNWSDTFEHAPLTADPDYPQFLSRILTDHQVDLMIPGIEQDVLYLSRHREKFAPLATLALNNPELIEWSADKWLAFEEFKKRGLPMIDTVCLEDQALSYKLLKKRFGSPFIVKPRRGYAGKGFQVISDKRDFEYWRERMKGDAIAQQLVGTKKEEYTVGVFGTGATRAKARISFRRELAQDGSTAKAKVVRDETLDSTVDRFIKELKPIGPTNFQFRFQDGQYHLLEVNPRISSSTSLRTAFGFNEASMCLDYYLAGIEPEQPEVSEGFAVRYIEDIITSARTHL